MPLVFVQRYDTGLTPTSNVGTQYVDGPLVISGTTNVYLSADLYTGAGVYVLFDWTGTGSFPNPAQVSNIVLNPPAGLTVSQGPQVVSSRILFKLEAI